MIKAQKRLAAGFTFVSTFTYARNEDNEWGSGGSNACNTFSGSTPPSQPQNYYNLAAEWALASTGTPFRFTNAFTCELPFGKGKRFVHDSKVLDYLVGGWNLNATAVYQTGFPLFIYQQKLNSVIGTGEHRPNATGISPQTSGSVEQHINSCINPAAFSQAPAFTFGNVSRSIDMLGPGSKNWDTSLFETVRIKERVQAQFRLEALNTFNSPVFANPNTQFGAASFGKISYQSNLPRQLLPGVRFSF